mmetsp:Transcript_5557/g.13399  ORF Transcript_5557/g.13399 Transcript_5557/m.13399 type:complete len:109 (+) Transcript_5557:302-628(+)
MVMILMTTKPVANSFVEEVLMPSRRTVSSSLSTMPPTPPAVVDDHVHPAVVLPLVQAKAEETVPVLLRAATPEDVVSFSQDKSFVDGKEWNLGGKWILVLQRKNEKKY